ncbi:MAG: hypothetical protein RBT74_06665 [Tenuifilaceae bacterium]|jgi:hypothetical protein|nr:hypothetical protein [Tenuifilaceae bacterium]
MENSNANQPVVLDGFVKPGFIARVYSLLLFPSCMVICKTGNFGASSAGSMRASMGGNVGDGAILGAIGEIFDSARRNKRMEKAASLLSKSPEEIAQSDKRNFLIRHIDIDKVEVKGPNFAGEIKLRIHTSSKTYKLRLDGQNKSSQKFLVKTLSEYMPGKVF